MKEIISKLREAFPYGHPDFTDMTVEELALHSSKNHDYARGGNPLGNFNRVGSILELYPGLSLGSPVVVAIVYALKQLDAALWMLCQKFEGDVENIETRLADVHVYMKLARILHRESK